MSFTASISATTLTPLRLSMDEGPRAVTVSSLLTQLTPFPPLLLLQVSLMVKQLLPPPLPLRSLHLRCVLPPPRDRVCFSSLALSTGAHCRSGAEDSL